ncbi:MAG: DUF2796 domain-containing protein [Paracoccaceae bacterium]|nr:DUF2796 domain-containing protein [Paracoccaceae bacterium]
MLTAGAAHTQTRELDAHQHGHGALNIAFEGASVAMELEVPGADIVGFEHPAESDADRALIDAAIAQLAKPLELFAMPAAAGCTVTAANVALLGEDDHDEHGDDHKDEHADDHKDEHDDDHKDEHADDHKDEHDDDHKDDHADDHKDDHADDHKDEHADEEGEEGHNEFHAEYALTCADPSAIDAIEFVYFERFPNAAELDIQLISDKGAKGFEVERDEPRLDLSGAI